VAAKREPLTVEDREDISRGPAKGLDNKDIAFSVGGTNRSCPGKSRGTAGRVAYRAWKAGAAARESRSRPKERKIDTHPELRGRVAGDLKKG
jgi:IS30 family transposase